MVWKALKKTVYNLDEHFLPTVKIYEKHSEFFFIKPIPRSIV